jgi:hypothetical protein
MRKLVAAVGAAAVLLAVGPVDQAEAATAWPTVKVKATGAAWYWSDGTAQYEGEGCRWKGDLNPRGSGSCSSTSVTYIRVKLISNAGVRWKATCYVSSVTFRGDSTVIETDNDDGVNTERVPVGGAVISDASRSDWFNDSSWSQNIGDAHEPMQAMFTCDYRWTTKAGVQKTGTKNYAIDL